MNNFKRNPVQIDVQDIVRCVLDQVSGACPRLLRILPRELERPR